MIQGKCHLRGGLKLGLVSEAVTLQWPLLPGRWGLVAVTEIILGTCTLSTLTALMSYNECYKVSD